MSRHVVAAVGEIAEGGRKFVNVEGREIGVFNVKGEFFALLNRCPHAGASLCRGTVIGLAESDEPGEYRLTRPGEFLRCPWHGWEFDIRTGQSWFDPQRVRTRAYKATIEPGAELVKGPYVAETFAVKVEENYVVIEA
ncbi:MAG TPA: Rieske (2Fe-2S) protein [Opitutaceae bacterium]